MSPKFVWSVALLLALAVTAAPRSSAGEKDEKKEPEKSGALLKVDGELTDDDPMDKVQQNSHFKTYRVKLAEGKTYQIDMKSKQVDPFLRLEDPKGQQVAFNDDFAPPALDSRIVYTPKKSGEYRVIATTYEPGKTGAATGKFTLTVVEFDSKKFLAELTSPLKDIGEDLTLKDLQKVVPALMSLEQSSPELAGQAYTEVGKLVAQSSDKKTAQFGKTLQGAGRRVNLLGKKIEVKGTLLDGKEFDWAKYKGKVVLVDFWATWCGPCRAEIPNIIEMHEDYHARGFEVVGISLDRTKDAATDYMEEKKLPWVSLFDPEPAKGAEKMTEYYGIFAIPQAILVDREGNVVSLNARGPELGRLLEKHLGPREKSKKKADPNRDLE